MDETRHTPGPWKVYENPRAWNDLGRETFPNADPPSPELMIGTEWNHPQLKGPDTIVTTTHSPYFDPPVTISITPANARLISAAPDLLAAAEKVLAGLHARIDAAAGDAVPVFDGIAELHAAIEKARGRNG